MTLELIDISQWQGAPNFDAIPSWVSGIIAKATEGNGYIDPQWSRNRSELLRVGRFVPGAYHFARPDLGNTPEAEADFFLSVVRPDNGWLLVLDAESIGGSAAWCDAFQSRVSSRLTGYHNWFYSYWNWIVTRGITGAALWSRDPIWLAWPDVNGPLPTGGVTMQQYGASPVPGINGDVDRNRFFGDSLQLAALSLGPIIGGESLMQSPGFAYRPTGPLLFGAAVQLQGTTIELYWASDPNVLDGPSGFGFLDITGGIIGVIPGALTYSWAQDGGRLSVTAVTTDGKVHDRQLFFRFDDNNNAQWDTSWGWGVRPAAVTLPATGPPGPPGPPGVSGADVSLRSALHTQLPT